MTAADAVKLVVVALDLLEFAFRYMTPDKNEEFERLLQKELESKGAVNAYARALAVSRLRHGE